MFYTYTYNTTKQLTQFVLSIMQTLHSFVSCRRCSSKCRRYTQSRPTGRRRPRTGCGTARATRRPRRAAATAAPRRATRDPRRATTRDPPPATTHARPPATTRAPPPTRTTRTRAARRARSRCAPRRTPTRRPAPCRSATRRRSTTRTRKTDGLPTESVFLFLYRLATGDARLVYASGSLRDLDAGEIFFADELLRARNLVKTTSARLRDRLNSVEDGSDASKISPEASFSSKS